MNAPATLDTQIQPITKISTYPFIDSVRGVIIGGDAPARSWAIYSKLTRNLQTQGEGESDDDCQEQAKAWVDTQKQRVLPSRHGALPLFRDARALAGLWMVANSLPRLSGVLQRGQFMPL